MIAGREEQITCPHIQIRFVRASVMTRNASRSEGWLLTLGERHIERKEEARDHRIEPRQDDQLEQPRDTEFLPDGIRESLGNRLVRQDVLDGARRNVLFRMTGVARTGLIGQLYDAAPDGRRFVVKREVRSSPIHVRVSWTMP